MTLDKLIEFNETFVLPQEYHRLRHYSEGGTVPVSGAEYLVQPVLKLWRTQEQRDSSGRNKGGTLLASRISSSLPPLGYQSINSTATTALPSSSNSGSPAAGSLTLKQGSSSTPVSKQWTDVIGIKDDDKKDVISKHIREYPSDAPTIEEVVSHLQESTASVDLRIRSVCNRISKGQDDDNSSGLSKTFFSQLRSSQTKAQGLGMRGIYIC